MAYKIEWNSEPILDGWGWGDFWGPGDWMTWHKKLKEKWGLQRANEVFIEWYHKAGFGASSYDWRTFNDAFISYAKENGFYNGLFDGLAGLVMKNVNVVKDAAGTVIQAGGDVVQGASKTVSAIGKNMTTIVVIILILAVLIGLAYSYNTFKTAKSHV